jgi:hypothetical protein
MGHFGVPETALERLGVDVVEGDEFRPGTAAEQVEGSVDGGAG